MPNFIMFVRANERTEGPFPPKEIMAAEMAQMGVFNTSMTNAGVLVSCDGLLQSSKGARVHFSSSMSAAPTVTRGPFDTSSLVSGYWIIKTNTLDDAIEWAKKVPFKRDDEAVEIRQISTLEDFGV
ncbi:hypothetical protein B0T18DRAFT_405474 [Schizothecium vesticola]|uniref:YCII-related domain-containing protein n=1 Tax=Schizothecium vesticola TaxID=314040 RepID=A0AA40F0E0_9PEZI|nr:hypothetical protein B0T18DRAFT_405474 [Schizothecium vesticola]